MYVTNSGNNTVSVINASTNTLVGKPIPVVGWPIGIAYNPRNNEMYVNNVVGNTVSVINASTNAVVGKPISTWSYPVGIAYNPRNNEMYVTHDLECRRKKFPSSEPVDSKKKNKNWEGQDRSQGSDRGQKHPLIWNRSY
jgi:YVTN family beta-propeller protein